MGWGQQHGKQLQVATGAQNVTIPPF